MTLPLCHACLPLQIELHLHADGACRIETLRELAREYDVHENGKPLPYDDLEKFKACVGLPNGATSLADFLTVFHTLDKILRCVLIIILCVMKFWNAKLKLGPSFKQEAISNAFLNTILYLMLCHVTCVAWCMICHVC